MSLSNIYKPESRTTPHVRVCSSLGNRDKTPLTFVSTVFPLDLMTCISVCSGLTSMGKVRNNSILVLSILDGNWGKWACVLQ